MPKNAIKSSGCRRHTLRLCADVDIVRPRPSRRKHALFAALVGLAVVVVATVFRSAPARGELLVEKTSVLTEAVVRKDFVRKVSVTGSLVPDRVEWLSAPTAARIARIVVRPGATVTASTVVVVLENPDLELLALEAEQRAASAESARVQLEARTDAESRAQAASLVSLHADLGDARRHADSSERLSREGLLGDIDRHDAVAKSAGLAARVTAEESRKSALDAGRARQIAAQAAEVARLREIAAFRKKQLASLEVRAKIDGIVQDVPLENGQWVAMGALLAKVAGPEKLRGELKVAEASAKDVRKGALVRFESPAGMTGAVERIDPAVVAGTVKLVVSLANVPPQARADQAVSGNVEIETIPHALVVGRPMGAKESGANELFVMSADGKLAARTVARLGRGSPREIEIESGLREGDRVVVSDTSAWDSARTLRIR